MHRHLVPIPGKVGPVCHQVPAHVDFGLRVAQRSVERPAEDELDLVAVHGAHPSWPGVDGRAVVEQVEERPTASHGVPVR